MTGSSGVSSISDLFGQGNTWPSGVFPDFALVRFLRIFSVPSGVLPLEGMFWSRHDPTLPVPFPQISPACASTLSNWPDVF